MRALSSQPHYDLNLSLAGAGDWATWDGGGLSAGDWGRVDLAVGDGGHIWNLSVLEGPSSLAASWTLSILLVSCDVEGDEEEEVRTEDTHASEGSKLLTSALASVRHVLEVGGGEVCV